MSHLFRRQTHLGLRLSVLEIINFKTASLGVYFLMSNSNFSANNFSSIDSEFSINNNSNNNINSEETMSNQQSSSDVLAALSNMPTTINQSIEESLKATLADAEVVPTWSAITDRERELVDAANEIADGSLVVHQTTFLNFAAVAPNTNDFYKSKIKLVSYQKGEVSRGQLEVEFAKFSMRYQSLDIREGLAVFSTAKPNGFEVTCVVDFEKGLFVYHAQSEDGKAVTRSRYPLAIRKYAMVSFNNSFAKSASATGIYHAEQTFALFASLIDECWTVDQFNALMGKMKAKLVIDTLAQAELNGKTKVYGRRAKVAANNNSLLDEVSVQTRIECHKIGLIAVFFGDSEYVISKDDTSMKGDEVTIADKVFAPLGLPVHTDKNARKYLVYGAGSMASGLAYDSNGNLVSACPIDDATKGSNRLASESFHHAINQSADWNDRDAEALEGEMLGSNLLFAIGNGQYARTEGINMPTVFAFSAFNLNNGIIETNATKSVSFSFDVPKSLSKTISVREFGEEVQTKVNELCEAALTKYPSNESLARNAARLAIEKFLTEEITKAVGAVEGKINGSSITVDGVAVIENQRDFEIVLDPKTLVVTAKTLCVSGSGTEFEIRIAGIAPMVGKQSPKLRGNTKKGTAYPTNTRIVDMDNWVTLLTGETVKASKGMLELVANHPKIAGKGVDLVWDAGVLTMGDTVFTPESLETFIKDELCQSVTIIHEVSKDELDRDEKLKALINDTPNMTWDADKELVTETNVLAFESYASYQVELSSADENAGAATLGVNEQYSLSSFHQSLSDKLDKLSKAEASKVQFMNANFNNSATVVDARDNVVISAIASMLDEANPKAGITKLAKAYPGGVKFIAAGFEAWCPFSALLHFTRWNGAFPASTMGGTTFWDGDQSEEVITKSLTAQVIELIQTLNDGVVRSDDELRDLFRSMSGVRGFLKSLRGRTHEHIKVGRKVKMSKARSSKKARKTVIAHHQKVVGDLTIGYRDGLPVVKIHPSNPMDVHVGDVVAISRCPLPMFTICKVELDDSLDKTVVAVNPITWIKSNLGDFDGDTIYITELKRLTVLPRPELVKLGVAYNNKYSGLATHWNIFDKSTSPLADALTGKTISDYSNFAVSVNPNFRAGMLTSVNQHYAFGVGKFFAVASALSESLGNKVFNGETLSNAEVLAGHRAWLQYEEDGLGGFKDASHKSLEEVKKQINTEIANPGSLKLRKVRGRVVGDPSINFLAIQAAAICEIGAEIYDAPTRADLSAESLSAQAFKRIA